MTEVITERMIIPVAIPTILLLIDGLSIRLDSWKLKLCAGLRADVSAVWSAINIWGELGLSGCRIHQLAISHQRCRDQALIEVRSSPNTVCRSPALDSLQRSDSGGREHMHDMRSAKRSHFPGMAR